MILFILPANYDMGVFIPVEASKRLITFELTAIFQLR